MNKPFTLVIAPTPRTFQRWRDQFMSENKVFEVQDNGYRLETGDRNYKFVHEQNMLYGYPIETTKVLIIGDWSNADGRALNCKSFAEVRYLPANIERVSV